MPADPRKQRIAELVEQPGFSELRAWVKEVRDAYYANLARELYARPDAVTETALNEKQAYFRGMARLLNEPLLQLQDVERDLAKTKDEVTELD